MNHTIKYQNTLLDSVTQDVDSNREKLAKQKKDIDKIIGK